MTHEFIQRMWRNKGPWLKSMLQINPVKDAGSTKKAAAISAENLRQELFPIRVQIMIYEAQPEKYESLDEIKIN